MLLSNRYKEPFPSHYVDRWCLCSFLLGRCLYFLFFRFSCRSCDSSLRVIVVGGGVVAVTAATILGSLTVWWLLTMTGLMGSHLHSTWSSNAIGTCMIFLMVRWITIFFTWTCRTCMRSGAHFMFLELQHPEHLCTSTHDGWTTKLALVGSTILRVISKTSVLVLHCASWACSATKLRMTRECLELPLGKLLVPFLFSSYTSSSSTDSICSNLLISSIDLTDPPVIFSYTSLGMGSPSARTICRSQIDISRPPRFIL